MWINELKNVLNKSIYITEIDISSYFLAKERYSAESERNSGFKKK